MNTTKKEITEHGISMYRYRKCRCEVCKEAAAIQRKQYRPVNDSVKVKLNPQPLIDLLVWAERLDEIEKKRVDTWRDNGIDVYWADHWCIKLGYHPAEVFGPAFYEGCFDQEFAA